METLLKQHPEDLLCYRPLRDISGAQFEHISLFQHCIWTKDVRYMANMMLDCLTQNDQGEQIRLKLVCQYEELMTKGVVYKLKGVKHENEHHFNLEHLITALRTYKENYDNWTDEQIEEHWNTVVGLAQSLIPAHIRNHYCEEAFWKNANFKKPKIKRSLEIYNRILDKSQVWSEGLVGLGSDFGISVDDASSRGPWCPAGPRIDFIAAPPWATSLTYLTLLDKARTEIDFPELLERLFTPIQSQENDLHTKGMGFSLNK